jgi:heat shock protein HslJ
MKKIFIYCLVLVFIVAGCKKESSKQPTLLNTQWVLSYIQDTKSNVINNYPADESKKIVIDFTDLSNVISFNGICNTGSGKYSFSTSTGTVEITDMATTKIACKYVEWESYTVQSMQEAYSYRIDGNTLVIYSKGDNNLYFIEN